MCSWRWAIAWGFALGMTFSCKATGWLAPLPFLIWAGGYRDRRAGLALLIGLPTALLTFYLLNPPLWHHPIQGLEHFFALNLNRGAQGLNISTQFLGQIYNLDHPLPWYNTLLWTGITVPFGILFLFCIGLWHVLRRLWDKPGMLLVANWLILLVVRAIPGTPPHDGVRLFLPSFAFLAALAGVGTARCLTACHGLRHAAVVGLVVFGGSATSLAWYAPQWLSYYNVLIGGLPGAVAMGMEPTYYWDGLDRDVLDWLHQHTEPGEKVEFACYPKGNLALMTQWGQLHSEYRLQPPDGSDGTCFSIAPVPGSRPITGLWNTRRRPIASCCIAVAGALGSSPFLWWTYTRTTNSAAPTRRRKSRDGCTACDGDNARRSVSPRIPFLVLSFSEGRRLSPQDASLPGKAATRNQSNTAI